VIDMWSPVCDIFADNEPEKSSDKEKSKDNKK
jgi:hypothetical protein